MIKEKYKSYLEDLESACERKDTLLIIHYHILLSSEKNYNPSIVFKGLEESMNNDIYLSIECARKGNRWNSKNNLNNAKLAAKGLGTSLPNRLSRKFL